MGNGGLIDHWQKTLVKIFTINKILWGRNEHHPQLRGKLTYKFHKSSWSSTVGTRPTEQNVCKKRGSRKVLLQYRPYALYQYPWFSKWSFKFYMLLAPWNLCDKLINWCIIWRFCATLHLSTHVDLAQKKSSTDWPSLINKMAVLKTPCTFPLPYKVGTNNPS